MWTTLVAQILIVAVVMAVRIYVWRNVPRRPPVRPIFGQLLCEILQEIASTARTRREHVPAQRSKIRTGALALVVEGPSAGIVVRCIEQRCARPGSSACALQMSGRPLWVTDRILSWDYWNEYQNRRVTFRCKAAPEHALMPIATFGATPFN